MLVRRKATTKRSTATSRSRGRGAKRVGSGASRRRSLVVPEAPLELDGIAETGAVELLQERELHAETAPILTGGDVDADWQRAWSAGDEAVAGSAPTPDQDVVDEIGRALGVEQSPDAEVRSSREILEARRRLYWHLARRAESEDER